MAEKVSMRDRPLVSMAMTTYNRKEYIREALAGVFAQTYDPLEIVISDDCSTDGTWEIINDEVRKYRERGGRHSVILSRNEHNLRVLRNFEKLVSMCHGELIVQCGDDDISLPNRAERTVEAWLNAGKDKVKLIHCSAVRINELGCRMRLVVKERDAFHSLGAVAAYSADVFSVFSRPELRDAYEDGVYACRAVMLGEELTLPDVLVKYRVGGGASTSACNYRESAIRSVLHAMDSYKQNGIDLEQERTFLGESKYRILKDRYDVAFREIIRLRNRLQGETMWFRFQNRQRVGWKWMRQVATGHLGNLIAPIFQLLLILPQRIGTPALNVFARILHRVGYPV